MKELTFYNPYHLGDCFFLVHFLRKVCQSYPDFKFICETSPGHFPEIQSFIGKEFEDRILLKKSVSKSQGINGWYGCIPLKTGYRRGVYILNERYDEFFTYLSDKIGIKNPIGGKNCTVIDHPDILKYVNPNVSCDILLVNSIPLSRQYLYVEKDFEDKIRQLKEKYTVVVTKSVSVPDVPCTMDYGLNLLGIGGVSVKAKYIIGIATAPIISCFNIWNLNTTKKWFVLSRRSTYSYNDRIFRKKSVAHISMSELEYCDESSQDTFSN